MEKLATGRYTDLAKTLVKTVARAFYSDDFVVFFDALTREYFIIYEELAPRLHMSQKDINRMIDVLENKEGLIKSQSLTIGEASWKCYYIDYQVFTNIVRYRVHIMKEELTRREAEVNSMNFQCLSCNFKCSSLESMKLLTKDMKRACPICCPSPNFASIIVPERFRLIEMTAQTTNSNIRSLMEKFNEQLSHSEDGSGVLHTGIFDLLAELKDVPLLRNLPSDNIDRGLWSSKQLDEDTMRGIEESTKAKAKVVGGSVFGSGQVHGRDEGRLQIEIQRSSEISAADEPAEKRIKSETGDAHEEDDVAWED
jgi:transcription initiation factor IIE alpha subunit